MKIVKLTSQNVMRLNAVEITPKGDMVIIGGKNGAGKSSVLESIMLAMGGRKAKIKEPLKKGAKKGKVELELDGTGLIVTRTFTPGGGGTLTVKSKEGAMFQSPQAMLDKISGALTFDPLAWVGMDDAKQMSVLKELTGLDLSAEDKARQEVYDARTEANRKLKMLQAQHDALKDHESVPDEEVKVADLMETLDKMRFSNQQFQVKKDLVERLDAHIVGRSKEIEKMESALMAAKKDLAKIADDRIGAIKDLEDLSPVNTAEIEAQIKSSDEINRKIRERNEKLTLAGRLEKGRTIIAGMTDKLDQIDKLKQEKLSSSKMPIEGLSFDEAGIYYRGVPFTQASSAEQLRVSVAMGIAMNPELKVLLIRDGSLLDEDSLKMVSEMAFDSGAQVWLERVSTGEECSIIISDGNVQEVQK